MLIDARPLYTWSWVSFIVLSSSFVSRNKPSVQIHRLIIIIVPFITDTYFSLSLSFRTHLPNLTISSSSCAVYFHPNYVSFARRLRDGIDHYGTITTTCLLTSVSHVVVVHFNNNARHANRFPSDIPTQFNGQHLCFAGSVRFVSVA